MLLLLIVTVQGFSQSVFEYKNFKTILARTKDSGDSLFYDKLRKRFVSNDSSLSHAEVLTLMIGFTAQPAYKPYRDLDTEREVYRLNNVGKFGDALALENKFLKEHPVSVKTIYEKSYTFNKLGQPDSAEYYLFQQQRIFIAMYYSGEGVTESAPTFALGPADSQDYITKFVGGKIKFMSSQVGQDGNYYDVIDAELDDGRLITLYFIIQHTMESPIDK